MQVSAFVVIAKKILLILSKSVLFSSIVCRQLKFSSHASCFLSALYDRYCPHTHGPQKTDVRMTLIWYHLRWLHKNWRLCVNAC